MWNVLHSWLILQWRLSTDVAPFDTLGELRLRAQYYQERGYSLSEAWMLAYSRIMLPPYRCLVADEVAFRRARREGLLDDAMWRRARLALANEWMRTYET